MRLDCRHGNSAPAVGAISFETRVGQRDIDTFDGWVLLSGFFWKSWRCSSPGAGRNPMKQSEVMGDLHIK
jgi:hypothetical protein